MSGQGTSEPARKGVNEGYTLLSPHAPCFYWRCASYVCFYGHSSTASYMFRSALPAYGRLKTSGINRRLKEQEEAIGRDSDDDVVCNISPRQKVAKFSVRPWGIAEYLGLF